MPPRPAAAAGDVDGALLAARASGRPPPPEPSDAGAWPASPCVLTSRLQSVGATTQRPAGRPARAGGGRLRLRVGQQADWTEVLASTRHPVEMLATVDVGSPPVKLQPADGRMWVRTTDAYVAIDPATNTVTTTLTKADVGPSRQPQLGRRRRACGSATAADCTATTRPPSHRVTTVGTRHRVRPGLRHVATWRSRGRTTRTTASRERRPPHSSIRRRTPSWRRSTCPSTSTCRSCATTPSSSPVTGNAGAASVDRQSWTVTEHELDVPLGGSQSTTDGTFIYVPTADKLAIAVIDARSHQVVDKIEPLEVNSVVATADGLWVVDNVVRLPPALRPRHLTGSARTGCACAGVFRSAAGGGWHRPSGARPRRRP